MSTVCRPIPHSCIALVDALDNLKSSISKLRALLRLGLQSKRLHLYFDAAINSRDIIRKFYRPSSILFSNELRAVNHAIVRLQNVDFCFDLRSDELNYPGVRTINYRRLFDPLPRWTTTRSDTAAIATASTASPTIDYSVGSPGADRFRYLESKLDSTIQQRNQLQAALTESYKHISRVKADLSRTTHENHVLRTAFDQLQQKFVLLHEEYNRELQRLGSSCKLRGVPPVRPCSLSIAEIASGQATTPVTQGLELTEDMDAVDCLLDASPDPNASAPARGGQDASPLLEMAPAVSAGVSVNCDRYEENSPSVVPLKTPHPLELSRCPVSSSTADRRTKSFTTPSGLTIQQQELPNPHGKFRLPNHDCLSPVEGELPITLERYCVTVKPKNINFRSRFALPLSTPQRSMPIDLFTEIQTADSSFPVAGISPASEATSYQVSEIAADRLDSSPGKATITTSTSTIKPNHSISVDESDSPVLTAVPSTHMTESDLSWARRSTSELEVRDYYTLTSPSEGEMDSSSESCNMSNPSNPKLLPSCFQPVRRERPVNSTIMTSPDSCRP
ncbi:hypothetical protein AAHC03_0665 [Spirometra sp. Aus1]